MAVRDVLLISFAAVHEARREAAALLGHCVIFEILLSPSSFPTDGK